MPDTTCKLQEANPGEYTTLLMDHDRSHSDHRYVNLTATPFSFGEYVTATAYYDSRTYSGEYVYII